MMIVIIIIIFIFIITIAVVSTVVYVVDFICCNHYFLLSLSFTFVVNKTKRIQMLKETYAHLDLITVHSEVGNSTTRARAAYAQVTDETLHYNCFKL